MPYLIDGSNLLGALPDFDRMNQQDQDRLVRRLLASPTVRKKGLSMVFDGSPSFGSHERILDSRFQVRWSGPQMDGDTLLRHLMDKSPPNRYILVTDDREVRDYAQAMGVQNIPCTQLQKFLGAEEKTKDQNPQNPFKKDRTHRLSPDEQKDWLEWFGEEPD